MTLLRSTFANYLSFWPFFSAVFLFSSLRFNIDLFEQQIIMEEQQRLHALSSHIQHYSPMDYHRFQSTYSMRPYTHPSTAYPTQTDCWFPPPPSHASPPASTKYESPFDYHSHPYVAYNPAQTNATELDYKSNTSASTKATVAAYFNFNFNCDPAHTHHHLFPENSSLGMSTATSPSMNYKTAMNKAQNLNDLSSTMRSSPKASSSGGSL